MDAIHLNVSKKKTRCTADLAEASHHFLYQWAHGCNVNYFEVIQIDGSIQVYVLSNFPQHCHQGNVGLTSSLWAQEKTQCKKPYTKVSMSYFCWRLLTVGAHTSRFSSVSMAVLKSLLWMRFRVLKPSNPAWAYFGNLSMATSTW